jgi:competence ComEA-like helix-hairpin-helix protein
MRLVSLSTRGLVFALGLGCAPMVVSGRAEASSKLQEGARLVDLNNANADDLMRLPGIGKRRAEDILRARAERPFRRPTDLLKIPGIGRKTFARLKPLVTVGPSTPKAGGASGARPPAAPPEPGPTPEPTPEATPATAAADSP